MDIDRVIEETAVGCGLNTYFYARVDEANLRLEDIQNYPILWRQFNEKIQYTEIQNERTVTLSLHFLDQLPNAHPDTVSEVLPIIRRMESACRLFLQSLKCQGVKLKIAGQTVTPTVEYASSLDAPLAGVRITIPITYKTCK